MEFDTTTMHKEFQRIANERILGGNFAREFMALEEDGPGVQKKLEELYTKANESELAQGEAKVRKRLGLKTI
jgi:ketol-acid reductoisomerase